MELRTRMLKDCLLEDSNSCSSNGFKSIPRRPPPLNPFPKRKQSNPLKAVINAVKNLRSNSVKSSPLQSSLSRRLSSKNQASITVIRVKDIVRWNSSNDLHEDISHLQLSPPHQFITKTTTTTGSSSTTTTTGTSCSSWCDSDLTSEFLLSSWGSNVEECGEKESGKNNLQCVSEDSCNTAITVADTEVGPEFENEYKSQVSVFEIQQEEDDEASNSSFSQCLDNMERTKEKLMQTIQRFETLANINSFSFDECVSMDEESCIEEGQEIDDENFVTIEDEIEEKATKLWKRVKERHAIWIHEEHLIMDYFRDELMQRNLYRDIQEFENELMSEAKGWLKGQREPELERGTSEEIRCECECVRDIERRDWNEKKMKEEHEEVVLQIEDGIFNVLMNETLTAVCEF